jgi:hypothetical protein
MWVKNGLFQSLSNSVDTIGDVYNTAVVLTFTQVGNE